MAKDSAIGGRIERTASAIARGHAAFLMQISAYLRKGDGDAARQHDIRLSGPQRAHRLCNRDERGGTGRADRQRRALETQAVGHTRGKCAHIVARQNVVVDLEPGCEIALFLPRCEQVFQHVGGHRSAREQPDWTGRALWIDPGVLQRFVTYFEENAALRIGQRRFALAHAEKFRVKLIDIAQDGACRDVGGAGASGGIKRILGQGGIKTRDDVAPLADHLPEGIERHLPRQPRGATDDCNCGVCRGHAGRCRGGLGRRVELCRLQRCQPFCQIAEAGRVEHHRQIKAQVERAFDPRVRVDQLQ